MGFDYHSQVLYVGQDIDKVVAQMAYIQLSLNGLYGYVCVGDSLCNPIAVDEDGNITFSKFRNDIIPGYILTPRMKEMHSDPEKNVYKVLID